MALKNKDKTKGTATPETAAAQQSAATPVAETEIPEQTQATETETPQKQEGKKDSPNAKALEKKLKEQEKACADMKKELDKQQKDLEDTVRLLQRNQADFENFRRRNNAVRAESYESGKRDAIVEMLPVLDDFERIVTCEGTPDEAWVEGVKLIYRKFSGSLKKLGLSPIEEEDKFDPNLHNAVLMEKVEGQESDKILAVLQKGYKVGDKIVRHSMVKVSE